MDALVTIWVFYNIMVCFYVTTIFEYITSLKHHDITLSDIFLWVCAIPAIPAFLFLTILTLASITLSYIFKWLLKVGDIVVFKR
jgi:hypothetical protein